jgi:uncharacterized protein YjbI with pentapeptide repeats
MANPKHLEMLMQGVEAWNEWQVGLLGADLRGANLRGLYLCGLELVNADLRGANLSDTVLHKTNLRGANLRGINLSNSSIARTDFSHANLNDMCLRGAHLCEVHLDGVDLRGVDFTGATLIYTTFGSVDLSLAKGLETVEHDGPSTIGINTIYQSWGNIPEVFLRGCGVHEDFITYARSLITKPLEFYSCFISYSSSDQDFAERLHSDLQSKGVRVWFAPHDLPIGAKIRPAIDESIRLHDKLLLVLSEASVGSQWVEQEVETALAREREQEGKSVLFPIRIDDTMMGIKAGWLALLKNTRNVGDFTTWKEHDSYRKAFDRLLRDLKTGA